MLIRVLALVLVLSTVADAKGGEPVAGVAGVAHDGRDAIVVIGADAAFASALDDALASSPFESTRARPCG